MKTHSRRVLLSVAVVSILGALTQWILRSRIEALEVGEDRAKTAIDVAQRTSAPQNSPVLKNGEVWIATGAARDHQLTNTNGKILNFALSKSGKYLAYEKQVGVQDDWGIYEGKPPQVPVREVHIVAYPDGASIVHYDRKFDGDSDYIVMAFWDDEDRLHFNTGSSGAVDYQYRFDAPARQLQIETWNSEIRAYEFEPYPETRPRHPK